MSYHLLSRIEKEENSYRLDSILIDFEEVQLVAAVESSLILLFQKLWTRRCAISSLIHWIQKLASARLVDLASLPF